MTIGRLVLVAAVAGVVILAACGRSEPGPTDSPVEAAPAPAAEPPTGILLLKWNDGESRF